MIGIMQPTFLPWLGYFALIESVDRFVFLDDVQFAKQSWQSRNRIKGVNGSITLSLDVARKPSKLPINKTRLADTGFEIKILKSIKYNLGRAPYFDLVYEIVDQAFREARGSLNTLNTSIITSICKVAGIGTAFYSATELGLANFDSRSGRLIALCQTLGGDFYLSPPGSYGYLTDERLFDTSPVKLLFFNFEHPTYPQFFGQFQSHVAVIDALAQVGPEEFRSLIRSGIRQPKTPIEFSREMS